MARGFGGLLISLLAGSVALVLGLAGTTLRTGRIDPLDWLFPAMLAMAFLSLLAWGGERALSWMRLITIWAVATVPALLFVGLAGGNVPWSGMALLACSLAIGVLCIAFVRVFGQAPRAAALSGLIVAALLVPRLVNIVREAGAGGNGLRPVVAVLSAMPLQGIAMGAAQGMPAQDSIGLRSPLWEALDSKVALKALDGLDDAAFAGVSRVLLAQPRGLAPAELVALDAWVRKGGQAIILSDPLLQWPDPRPLAHPARAPLTSLLDPLLTHWGLRLESAEVAGDGERVARRLLSSGAMLQLAGASRFSKVGAGASCVLRDEGLIADCRVGAGRALLIADADWINDTLWTLSPQAPHDRRAWTSDAIDLIGAWSRGEAVDVGRWTSWVAGEGTLIGGLRAALLLMLLLAIADWFVARHPSLSQRRSEINIDQTENINKTSCETG